MNAKLNEGHAAFALASFDELYLLLKHNYSIYQEYLYCEVLVSSKFTIRRYNDKMRPSYKTIIAELDIKFIDYRDQLIRILDSIDIYADMYFYPPLHEKKGSIIATKSLNLHNAELYSRKLLILPSGWQIKKEQIKPLMILINRILEDIYK